MKNLRKCVITLFILTGVTADAKTNSSSFPEWGNLSSWVGQYPVQKHHKEILKLQKIKFYLDRILTASDQKLLRLYQTMSPIQLKGDFLVISQCRPHDCPGELAVIVIDTKKTRIWVGFHERTSKYVSSRWIGNDDDFTILPVSIRDKLEPTTGVF